ncbi:MAG: COX15/CtaA family protein, partial [Verrucomicrobia bacterium]|nr:COX15/CtaA family protein [Verrucomicrobiota bacterium]
GGLVTSHEAGMAVPDWPNSFGYNMFLFPVSRWIGNVFFEHTHRLIASGVGLLTLVFCALTLRIEDRRWVKALSGAAVVAVIVQGVLGGLRVTEHNTVLGLFHGCLAQGFLALMAVIALVTSRFWRRLARCAPDPRLLVFQRAALVLTAMVFLQLVLGAAMRHSHAGLSIHDFPTVYGGVLPPLDARAVDTINQTRALTGKEPPTSAALILLQYVHRVWAAALVIGIVSIGVAALRQANFPRVLKRLASIWMALVFAQFALGAWTIWSNKAADVATSHVLFGALTLVTGVLLSVILCKLVALGKPDPATSTPLETARAWIR